MSHPSADAIDRPRLRRFALFLIALLVRAVYLYLIRGNPFFDSPIIDAQTYDEQAQEIARGVLSPGEAFWQPPLYPYLLGLLYAVVGRDLVWARMLQAMLSAAVCVLASELAVRRFGPRVAWLTGLLLAFYGPLLFYTGELLVPPLSMALDLAVLLALTPPRSSHPPPRSAPSSPQPVQAPDRRADLSPVLEPLSGTRLAVAGLLLGLSAVARPTILLVLPVFLVWLSLPARGGELRTRLLRTGVFAAFTLLPILPVTLHNLQTSNEPILISSNGGINFYIGNNARYDEVVGIRPGLPWSALILEPEQHGASTPGAASRYWTEKALAFIAGQPLEALELLLKKSWLLLQAWEIPRNVDYNFFVRHHAPALGWTVQFGALFPLAVAGLWLTRRTPDQGHWRIFLVCTALSVVAFFVVGRYRISLVPVLAIYAAVALEALWQALNGMVSDDSGAVRQRRIQALKLGILIAAVAVLIQLDPFQVARIDEAEGVNLVGKALSNAGHRREAIEKFEQAVSLNPELTDAHFNLARELQLEQRCDRALPHYARVLSDFPRERETLNNLAICYLSGGRTAEGLALLERMRDYYPDVAAIYFNLAQAYLKVDRLDDARAAIETGLRLEPDSEHLRSARSEVEQRLQARTRLDALRREPPISTRDGGKATAGSTRNGAAGAGDKSDANPIAAAAKALNNEAHMRLSAGDPAGARTLLLEALRQAPRYSTAWSNLGQASYLLQDFAEARRAFEKALEFNPAYWKARLGLALTLGNGFQDVTGARQQLEQVATQAPEAEATMARKLLAELPAHAITERGRPQ